MYLLPGNPFSHAVEAYRDSGEARCPNYLQQLPVPFTPYGCTRYNAFLGPGGGERQVWRADSRCGIWPSRLVML